MRRGPRSTTVVIGVLAALLLAVGLGACGGGSDDGDSSTTATGAERVPSPTTPAPPHDGATPPPPSGNGGTTPTPPSSSGTTPPPPSGGNGGPGATVDPADVQVVLAWATTLQRGDVRGASELFALPSAVSNGGRPVALTTRAEVRAFNRSLPCGADLVDTRAAADGFFVATFRLTDRPGGDCGSGTGNTASTAFHVTDGLIDHWLRVEDLEAEPAPGTPT